MSLCTFAHHRSCWFASSLHYVLAALLVSGIASSSAWAQQQTVVVTGRASQQRGSTTSRLASSLGQALQPDNFNWNARENGILLSINIRGEAEPERLQARPDFGFVQPVAPPETARGNRLPDIAERFNRRVVTAGSVTVLAPTMTTALAARLPKADIYADLSVGEKLRRLQSTLTPAQWRLLASPGGLGESDLKSTQKTLFASLLPDPLFLTRTRNENGKAVEVYEQNPAPVALSRTQRAGVRLTVFRTLSWWFTKSEPGSNSSGSVSIGVNTPTGPNETDTFTLREKQYNGWNSPETTLFGATVKAAVPARVKPTDLDYASSALDAAVSLANAKTVGELVERAQKATNVSVFCDPRYRDLTFVSRAEDNQGARAGDLLKALAVGVCGTFRRVADKGQSAYVLTDDLEGLGSRQARIAEWAQEAAAARQMSDAEVEDALKNVNIGDYVGWSATDPMAPTGDLAQRIEDYRAGKDTPPAIQSGTKTQEQGLWVPVSDLPAAAQDVVTRQIESWNRGIEESQKQGDNGSSFYKGLLRTDKVHLNVQTGLAFLIPGVGQVSAGSLNNYNNRQDLLTRPFKQPAPSASVKRGGENQAESFHWPQVGGTVRALLVPLPKSEQAAAEAASLVKAHGFNQLWVELPPGDSFQERLTQTIKAATNAHLEVQAVAHPTRRLAGGNADLARDRNVLGETMSEWAQRRASFIAAQTAPAADGAAYLPEDYSRRELARSRELERRAVGRQKPWGDFLDIGDAGVQNAISADLSALMQTPQLAGVVVRGFAAPGSTGYGIPYYGSGLRSVVEDFGYTFAQRLHFLLKNGVDPIDLSPLQQGQLPLPWGVVGQFGPPPSINLPQMPDYGANAQNMTINGVTASDLGAKNSAALWKTLRQETTNGFWSRLRNNAAAQSPNALLRELDESSVYETGEPVRLSSVGTEDKPAPVAASSSAELKKPSVPQTAEQRAASAKEKWHQRSSTSYVTFRYDPSVKSTAFYFGTEAAEAQSKDPARQFYNLLKAYLNAYKNGGPDGLVIDLSAVPLDNALPLLRDLPDEPIVSVPDKPLSAKILPK